MLKIEEKSAIEQIRILASQLGGDLKEGINNALLKLDNENAKGRIYVYEMMKGLSIRSFEIHFSNRVIFRTGGGTDAPIFMIYCRKGYYYQGFADRKDPERISKGQNVIISPADNEIGNIEIPAGIDISLCLIAIEKSKVPDKFGKNRSGLELILKDLYSKVRPYGHFKSFSSADSQVDNYAKLLIKNDRTDVVGRLLTEAAVLNLMAEQLDLQEKGENDQLVSSPLTESEMDRILSAVSDMQNDMEGKHTIKLFSKRTGLSPKKIQDGFQFIFGLSFAGFLKDLRLELAREYLETSEISISNIADNIGIASKSHLSRIFRERYAMSPRTYRESLLDANASFELTYRSKASVFIGESDISDLVTKANTKNIEFGVTGCLIYYKEDFFQILEGPKREVLRTFEAIRTDYRHEDIEILFKGPRQQKVFKENGMILLSDRDVAMRFTTGRNLSVDINTLVVNNEHDGLSSKMFWERIRNRILTARVA